MSLRSWLLDLSLKIKPVGEPPEIQVFYIKEDNCYRHTLPILRVEISRGVWICPKCADERIRERIPGIIPHPHGKFFIHWFEEEKRKKSAKYDGEETVPLLAMPKRSS